MEKRDTLQIFVGEFQLLKEESGPPSVSQLNFYPVKSLGGRSRLFVEVGPRGFVNDRNWMVVDHEGSFLTQRVAPTMALIKPWLSRDSLRLTAPDMPAIELSVSQPGDLRLVDIWKSSGVRAVDQGDQVAEWLSQFLERDCRLVRMANDEVRPVDPNFSREGDQLGFADSFPFLLISEASLKDLNSRLVHPLPMNRFRPNLVEGV